MRGKPKLSEKPRYKLGQAVKVGKKRYLVTAWKAGWFQNGSEPTCTEMRVYCLVELKPGMKAADLGRKFDGPLLEREFRTIPSPPPWTWS